MRVAVRFSSATNSTLRVTFDFEIFCRTELCLQKRIFFEVILVKTKDVAEGRPQIPLFLYIESIKN